MKKFDLILPEDPAPIKIGSKVVFIDGSFTLSINKDSFELTHDSVGLSEEIYTVIAVNVPCPTKESTIDCLNTLNNCIVKSDDGDIVFCSEINIMNIRKIGKYEPPFNSILPIKHI